MELGFEGVLMNTAIAEAEESEKMAEAMKLAVQAGRLAYLAGRMPKKLYASASSPLAGVVRYLSYKLHREQWLPRPLDEMFAFLDAGNLVILWSEKRILSAPIGAHRR